MNFRCLLDKMGVVDSTPDLLVDETHCSFSMTPERATSLVEKMVSNQGWSDDRLQPCQRDMHSVKETRMLAMKIDLLLKKFEDYSQDKAQMQTFKPWKLA